LIEPESRFRDMRKTPRRKTLKGGQIVFDNGHSTIECVIRNMSKGGAMLTVTNMWGVPNRFVLKLSADSSKFECRVAWKKSPQVGVQYV
jgi:PilZ domain